MQLTIQHLNWPNEWPHLPITDVDVSPAQDKLIIHYHVHGDYIRAVAVADQQAVWEDSCVEFFCQVPGQDTYMNFETNCVGTMVASRRRGRSEDVVPFTPEQMATIERWSSLPLHCPITDQDTQPVDWEVEIRIPWLLILGVDTPSFPVTLRANFYKCGDKTKLPHFVSWQPIRTPQPDFHRPEFFQEITLDPRLK